MSSTRASSSTTEAWWRAPTRHARGGAGLATPESVARREQGEEQLRALQTTALPLGACQQHNGPSKRFPSSHPARLQNRPDTNGSQFFVTLDRADHCNRQYTIFGKITGAHSGGGRVQRRLRARCMEWAC